MMTASSDSSSSRSSMSLNTSGTPKRSASARAFGPSLSHSATSFALRILERIGKCAVCGTAPVPISATRTSLDGGWANAGSRVVCAEYDAEGFACARASDGAPLTHPDAMTVALTAQRHALDKPVAVLTWLDGKIGTREYLATGRPQNVTDVVAAHGERPTIGFDVENTDASRRRSTSHVERSRAPGRAGRRRVDL